MAADPGLVIAEANGDDLVSRARDLFREYETWLDIDLSFQGFASELAGLPDKYAPPTGILLLAFADGALAGCCALRAHEGSIAELKRLWVRPEQRHRGAGRELVRQIIERARAIGYRRILLDTLPHMQGALELYKRAGFQPTAPYYDTPLDDTIFLSLEL